MFDLSRYSFFDYKTSIEGYAGQDFLGLYHILFILVGAAAVALLCYRFRRCRRETIRRYLGVLFVVLFLLEIVKILWEAHWDLSTGGSFNWTGTLPLYTCTLLVYTLPFAVWGKGKARDCALCFLTTLGIFSGATNFFVPPVLNLYPFFTFGTFLSLNYHFLMVFTGVLLLVTGYFRPIHPGDARRGWVPVICLSAIVIPANFLLSRYVCPNAVPGPDYMLYQYGYGAPFLPQLADFFRSHGLILLYSLLVLLLYGGITALMAWLCRRIFSALPTPAAAAAPGGGSASPCPVKPQ